jgi:hypothetical protein
MSGRVAGSARCRFRSKLLDYSVTEQFDVELVESNIEQVKDAE